jgi:hypothetical protein
MHGGSWITWSRYIASPQPAGNTTAASKTRQQIFAANSKTEGRSEPTSVPQKWQTVRTELFFVRCEVHIFRSIEVIFVCVIAILL